ncbi:MAG: FkbM family methyltransferase [Saprospiraceae bacterium]|nr:FkbM family methyltransferase [Saprospiraceae bacterium]
MTVHSFIEKISFINTISSDPKTRLYLIKNVILLYLYSKFKTFFGQINVQKKTIYHVLIENKIIPISLRIIDLPTFFEIFKDKIYYLPKAWVPQNATIIDLGAHVGCTALFFLNQFQIDNYIALEPSIDNYTLLVENTSSSKIVSLNFAIFSKNQTVKINTSSASSQNHHLDDHIGKEVPSVNMETLIETYQIEKIDVLKIDIEGAESTILNGSPAWLLKVNVILIELHGDYNIESFKRDLLPFGFTIINGHNVLGIKMICAHRMQ